MTYLFRRSMLVSVAVALSGGLIGAAWLLGIGSATWPGFPRRFDATVWHAAAAGARDGTDDGRCRMVDDLRWRIGLNGRTPSDVIALLGDEREAGETLPQSWILCPTMADYMVLRLTWKDGRVVDSDLYQS